MDSEWEGELQEVRPVSTSSRMDTSALSKLYLYVVKWVHMPPPLSAQCLLSGTMGTGLSHTHTHPLSLAS
jgi:hypothetical protein